MSESKDLVVVEGEYIQLGTVRTSGPVDVIYQASEIASSLASIVKDRKLFTTISGKNFVRVEGWTTLGAMLGVMPREVETHPIENGYESMVELVRTGDGAIIGRGSAICTRDEKNWKRRDAYAVRSMAITRATGKAYRLAFSWIMTLAGYEATPAEEMPHEQQKQQRRQQPIRQQRQPVPQKGNGNNTDGRKWSSDTIKMLVEAELADTGFAAVGMLNLSELTVDAPEDVIIQWSTQYREARNTGAESKEAATVANAWWASELAKAAQ